jgi:hypothetical protein
MRGKKKTPARATPGLSWTGRGGRATNLTDHIRVADGDATVRAVFP